MTLIEGGAGVGVMIATSMLPAHVRLAPISNVWVTRVSEVLDARKGAAKEEERRSADGAFDLLDVRCARESGGGYDRLAG
jgi:hypothetical protein